MVRIFLILLSFAIAPQAFAEFEAQQVVSLTSGSAKQDINFHWKVGSRGFRLDVTRNRQVISYIFNGRNFYACSRLTKERLKELKSFESLSQKKLERGVCQAVPANFMARFFLSPQSAILNLDLSDGMNYTLNFGKYSFKQGKIKKVGKESCQTSRRTYTILRKEKSKLGSHEVIDEQVCALSKYDWRAPMWRQMRRQLMRQPSAKALVKGLAEDVKNLKGFVYSGEGSFEKRDAGGVLRKGKQIVKTLSLGSKKVNPKDLRNPLGYVVIDIRQLAMEAKVESSKKSATAKKEAKDKIPRILLFMLGGFRF